MLAARIACIACLVIVGVLTLTPGHGSLEGRAAFQIQSAVDNHVIPGGAQRADGSSARARQDRALAIVDVIDLLANVALFVPLGIAVALGWPSRRWWLVAALSVASGTIELLQAVVITSRSAQLSDWIANSLGAVIGVLAVGAVARRRSPEVAEP